MPALEDITVQSSLRTDTEREDKPDSLKVYTREATLQTAAPPSLSTKTKIASATLLSLQICFTNKIPSQSSVGPQLKYIYLFFS